MRKKKIKPLRFTRPNPPYDTGKVLIGLRYTRPAPEMTQDDERIQAVLLGIPPCIPDEIKTFARIGLQVAVACAILYLLAGGGRNV